MGFRPVYTVRATFMAYGVPSRNLIPDWVPSLPLVLPSLYVAIQMQTASDLHYYEPADSLYRSLDLPILPIQGLKRSVHTIPYFYGLRLLLGCAGKSG